MQTSRQGRHTPLFAKAAHEYLQKDDPAQALKIALEGLKHFPEYPTGLLIAAEAHVMLRHFSDARQLLLQLLRSVPACRAAEVLLDRIVELEVEYPPRDRRAEPVVQPDPIEEWNPRKRRNRNWSRADELIPGMVAEPSQPMVEIPMDEEVRNDLQESGSGLFLERLAEQLEHARIPLIPDDAESDAPDAQDTLRAGMQKLPATETMAKIYAQQGNYEAAIQTYLLLSERFPDRKTDFALRIADIEKLKSNA